MTTFSPKAFALAATHSGAGKTTLTLGLLEALQRKGMKVQPFKCGPDFIDPTLHKLVTGKVSRNLDLKMCGPDFVTSCFNYFSLQAEISLIEGVMGMFDGGEGSIASLAKHLNIPVILIVDVKASAESIAAVVKGFETLDPGTPVAGVIFNRVGSSNHLRLIKSAVNKHCQCEILGFLPRNADFTIPDRHLGLLMGDEEPLNQEQLTRLAESIESNIDLDRLLAICDQERNTHGLKGQANYWHENNNKTVRIGVARDKVFCFYYQDNLDIWQSLGAEIIKFSPLADESLPSGLDAIYLGGGYPELYAKQLSQNKPMLRAIHQWSRDGKPLFAECGGFMYLTEGIIDQDQVFWPLAGVYPVKAMMKKRLSQLGYRQAELVTHCLFGDSGVMHGHEFHYSEIEEMPGNIQRVFRLEDGRAEGYQINNTLGGYVHFHFGQCIAAANNFIEFAKAK